MPYQDIPDLRFQVQLKQVPRRMHPLCPINNQIKVMKTIANRRLKTKFVSSVI